jgi:alpha-tubulin N-acetyltransferase 1
MLQAEGVRPEKLGYDRPSEKLLAFLAKHYGLKRYVPQNNNYVVYSVYFESGSGGVSQSELTRSQPQL